MIIRPGAWARDCGRERSAGKWRPWAGRSSFGLLLLLFVAVIHCGGLAAERPPGRDAPAEPGNRPAAKKRPDLDPLVTRTAQELLMEQRPDGGWGERLHADVPRETLPPDQQTMPSDPATTAFAIMALVRTGYGTGYETDSGKYAPAIVKGTEFLVKAVEDHLATKKDLQLIRPIDCMILRERTLRADFGPLVDTVATAQALACVLPTLSPQTPQDPGGKTEDPYAIPQNRHRQRKDRVRRALDVCLRRLSLLQSEQGCWSRFPRRSPDDHPPGVTRYLRVQEVHLPGFPTVQSALGCSALDLASVAGVAVDGTNLARARDYHIGNFDLRAGQAVTIQLLPWSGAERLSVFASTMRATAPQARVAEELLREAIENGRLDEGTKVTEASLAKLGLHQDTARRLSMAWRINQVQQWRVDGGRKPLPGQDVYRARHHPFLAAENMSPFGGFAWTRGIEALDLLDCLLISEALVISHAPQWPEWKRRMWHYYERRARPDPDFGVGGDPSGWNYRDSGVLSFRQSMVILSLTADRDPALLKGLVERQKREAVANRYVAPEGSPGGRRE